MSDSLLSLKHSSCLWSHSMLNLPWQRDEIQNHLGPGMKETYLHTRLQRCLQRALTEEGRQLSMGGIICPPQPPDTHGGLKEKGNWRKQADPSSLFSALTVGATWPAAHPPAKVAFVSSNTCFPEWLVLGVLRKTVVKKGTNVPGNPDLHRFRLGSAGLLKLPFLRRSLLQWVNLRWIIFRLLSSALDHL